MPFFSRVPLSISRPAERLSDVGRRQTGVSRAEAQRTPRKTNSTGINELGVLSTSLKTGLAGENSKALSNKNGGMTMRFMMLVKANKDCEAGVLPDEKMLSEIGKYNENLVKAGALLAVDVLQGSSKGARVRYSDGKFKVVDGPFAETKELIGGFWLIQAKSREEAIEWAKRVPFQEGEVEVRQLFELPDFPVDPAEKPDGWRN